MAKVAQVEVSTLLEILGGSSCPRIALMTMSADVSTLLEILGLVCLVVVGF